MSDYLENLLARTRNPASVVRPRLASMFEPRAPAAASAKGRPSFETETFKETPSTKESPMQGAPVTSTITVQPTPKHFGAADGMNAARSEQKLSEAGQRHETGEETSQRFVRPQTDIAPASSLPKPFARESASETESIQAKPQRTFSDSPQLPAAAARGHQDSREAVTATEANKEKIWPRIEPKIRQIVDEQLAPLELLLARERDGKESAPPARAQAATSTIIAHVEEKQPVKSAPSLNRATEIASPLPSINVSIGRVDVRAIISQQQTAPALSRRSLQQAGVQSLDEYLKQRSGGRQ